MHIFIDTTVLRSDFYLGSPDAKLLEQFVRTTHAHLAVPRVVIEEAKNQFREEVEKGNIELEKMSRLIQANPEVFPRIDVNTLVVHYEKRLQIRLTSEFKAMILDYPTVPHEVIIQRDLHRQRPFSKSGKGYRDTLIWHSILERMKTAKDEFVFITDNTHDFWNESAKELHSELRSDIKSIGGIVGPFRMFRNLSSFNNEIVKPKLAKVSQLRLHLQNNKFPYLSIQETAEEFRDELTDKIDHSDVLRHIRREYDVHTSDARVLDFGRVTRFENIEVTEVFEMPNANWFIRFSAECEMTVVFVVPFEQDAEWENAGFIDAGISGEGFVRSIDLPIRAEFALIYNPELRQLESHEVSGEF